MGAKIILNSRYFHVAKPGEKANGKNVLTKGAVAGLVEYVGTRETVALNIDKSFANNAATFKQKDLINQLIDEFPQVKDTHEYTDYLDNKTILTASEFISRATELATIDRLATDDGVLPQDEVSNLVDYVANRPGVMKVENHGLFSSDENLDLQQTMEDISSHEGNIWTHIISLRREDADRLGYDSQDPWRSLVMNHIDTIAENSNISLNNIKWYAGMHNTGHHPHIHLFVYSNNPKEGFVSKQGLEKIKSSLARDIFADDLKQTYTNKTNLRNELKTKAEELLKQISASPQTQLSNDDLCFLVEKMNKLSSSLPERGKGFYGFMPKEIKPQVDEILQKIFDSSPVIQELYREWAREELSIESTYKNNPSYDIPISENSTFYSLKNSIVSEAVKLRNNLQTQSVQEQVEVFNIDDQKPGNEKDPLDEIELIDKATAGGDINAAYKLGKHYEFEKDIFGAQMWYGIAAAKDHELSNYKLSQIYFSNTNEQNIPLGLEYALNSYHGFKGSLNYQIDYRFDTMDNLDEWLPDSKENSFGAYKQYLIGRMWMNGELLKDYSNVFDANSRTLNENVTFEPDYERAKLWFAVAAYNSNTDACYMLGKMAGEGLGQEADIQNAIFWYTKAAEDGHTFAQYKLGELYSDPAAAYHNPELAKKHYANAMKSFEKNYAEEPNAINAYRIAQMHELGKGTEPDPEKAIAWYTKAAEDGHTFAQYKLGELYSDPAAPHHNPEIARKYYANALKGFEKDYAEEPNAINAYRIAQMHELGKGTELNLEKTISWYAKAAEGEHSFAQYKLGELYSDPAAPYHNPEVAKEHYANALKGFEKDYAEEPNAINAYRIAQMHELGKGTELNLEKTISWYAKAAEGEHSFAQYKLGELYSDPAAPYHNPEVAKEHYANALKGFEKNYAEEPSAINAYRMAQMHELGKGTEPDLEKAIAWYSESANQNNTYAECKLGDLYSTKDSPYYNPLKAEQLYQNSLNTFKLKYSENPNGDLALKIGTYYHYGKGVDRNFKEAKEWYSRAAAIGNESAGEQMDKLQQDKQNITQSATALSVLSLLNHMGKTINNNHQNNLKQRYTADRKVKSQEKKQKMALGQNEKDQEQEIYMNY